MSRMLVSFMSPLPCNTFHTTPSTSRRPKGTRTKVPGPCGNSLRYVSGPAMALCAGVATTTWSQWLISRLQTGVWEQNRLQTEG